MIKRITFTIILGVILLLLGPAAHAQENTGFETTEDSSALKPAHWYVGGKGYRVTVTNATAYEGRRSLRIEQEDPNGNFGVATQSISTDSLAGKRVRVAGFIKTNEVKEGHAALWVRADGPDGILTLNNMGGEGATGTAGWARYEAEILVPQNANRILFGALMPGNGTAWYDSLSLSGQAPEDLPPPSEDARTYLDRALTVMQKRSINRDSIDWPALRENTMRWARGAETTADAYPALRYAIDQLGDNHSFLHPPEPSGEGHGDPDGDKADDEEERKTWEGPAPRGQLLSGETGYIRVPGFGGGERAQVAFADSLQHIIARLDSQGACGWVVDLRSNTGGNMWPMLAGLGPVLGEGNVGAFVYPDGQKVEWWYRAGRAGNGEDTLAHVSGGPYKLEGQVHSPVAVLTGHRTASSGEAVAVAFRGRPQTRSFGQPTRGLSTSNEGIPLGDGATLLLTTSTFADRAGTTYGGEIVPDVAVEPLSQSSALSNDPVVQAAQSWLKQVRQCTGKKP